MPITITYSSILENEKIYRNVGECKLVQCNNETMEISEQNRNLNGFCFQATKTSKAAINKPASSPNAVETFFWLFTRDRTSKP